MPQQQAWVVERFGKFHAVLEPGLNLLIPLVDQIRYVHTLKEIVVEIPAQSGITQCARRGVVRRCGGGGRCAGAAAGTTLRCTSTAWYF